MFATDEIDGFSPEVFSRAHGDIYLAGLNSAALAVERIATETKPDPTAIAALRACAARMLGTPESELDIVREALCHRPVGPAGRPLITRLHKSQTGVEGNVFVATGHGPWGISMSLGTGLVMAQMILGRELSVDISLLDI